MRRGALYTAADYLRDRDEVERAIEEEDAKWTIQRLQRQIENLAASQNPGDGSQNPGGAAALEKRRTWPESLGWFAQELLLYLPEQYNYDYAGIKRTNKSV